MRRVKVFHPLKILAVAGYASGVLCLAIAMVLGATPASVTYAQSGSGSIWTTTDTCGDPQNVNHYVVGAVVYINGDNFDPNEAFAWDITRVSGSPPKPTVASGNDSADGNGAFCFAAYTIQSSDVGHTYQATVGGVKSDNFRVEAAQAEPTNTPTNTAVPPTNTPLPTDTPTPTEVPPTNTPLPTDTPTPTEVPPTDTPLPTDTPTPTELPPTNTPQPTAIGGTEAPTPTATNSPVPTNPPPTSVPPTDPAPTEVPLPISTTSAVLIPVTGLDFNSTNEMAVGLFNNLGIALLGFGFLMHGAWLRFGKEK